MATAGESVTVEPKTAHQFWNASETAARFRCTVTPALQFEQLLETMFGLANDGKTSAKGLPNPLRLAVIANNHFDDVRLPFPPAWVQKLGLVTGAPVGRCSATARPTPRPRPARSRSRKAREASGSGSGLTPTPLSTRLPRVGGERVHDGPQPQARRRQRVLDARRARVDHPPLEHPRRPRARSAAGPACAAESGPPPA